MAIDGIDELWLELRTRPEYLRYRLYFLHRPAVVARGEEMKQTATPLLSRITPLLSHIKQPALPLRAVQYGILCGVLTLAPAGVALADEDGVSFWLPGLFGSLAAGSPAARMVVCSDQLLRLDFGVGHHRGGTRGYDRQPQSIRQRKHQSQYSC
jgi:hypothetical protein